jgi:diguanylate cyclase
MMNTVVVELLLGLSAMTLGALGATGVSWIHFRRKSLTRNRADAHHAARVLVHLQELATRVAFDVDKHSDQVEEINETLVTTKTPEPKMIVDVVAKLIQANQQMHEQLASTEVKLREQAQRLQAHVAEARTDALTLLLNRRAFDDELARRCSEFKRQGRVFSLIMSDVDNFKQFNDAHGHQAGDEVLRGVAKVLRRKMREMDFVARYGGEEFAIILPGTNINDAEKAAFRACDSIAKSQFNSGDKELQVTMSFGLAEIQAQDDGLTLVARADKALYTAKEGGRNCIFRHDGEMIHRSEQPHKTSVSETTASIDPEPIAKSNSAITLGIEEKTADTAVASSSETPGNISVPQDSPAQDNFFSRSIFCQQVRFRTAEWKRGGSIFSVLLIEVNEYGLNSSSPSQQWNSVAMQAAISYLASSAREMDVLGYYASGCLAMLLPTAELVDAIHVAERLREGFLLANPMQDDEQIRLALSVGVVQVMDLDDSISVLKRAEEALDAAVRRGGDRVYYHDGTRCAPITAMLETMDYLS